MDACHPTVRTRHARPRRGGPPMAPRGGGPGPRWSRCAPSPSGAPRQYRLRRDEIPTSKARRKVDIPRSSGGFRTVMTLKPGGSEIKRAAVWRLVRSGRNSRLPGQAPHRGIWAQRGRLGPQYHRRPKAPGPGSFRHRGPYLHREPSSSRVRDLAPRT